MMTFLHRYFPSGHHYFVHEIRKGDIDHFLYKRLFEPFQKISRHNLWGERALTVSKTGRYLGWIPVHFTIIFFNETVLREIAGAMTAGKGQITAGHEEMEKSEKLLRIMGLADLGNHPPHVLSEGETKMVWFLCQWAKCPDYLILSDLWAGLSHGRAEKMIAFINQSEQIARTLDCSSPVYLLGISTEKQKFSERFVPKTKWITVGGELFAG